MKKEEKELIYNLLKTSDSYFYGYTRPKYCTNPLFSNDSIQSIDNSPSSKEEKIISNTDSEIANINQKTENQFSVENHSQNQNLQHGLTISELNSKILRCTRCQLARTRNNIVPGQGVEHPDVMVVGEGPGYDEDIQGLPFVGKAGKLLDKMLAAIQLDRNKNCYIANIVKCRPPQNRDPQPEEQAACISFLEAQIHILKPKMILCMGRISGQKLLETQIPVGQLRGQFHDYHGIPVLVTYHPSALLRNEELKRPAWEDLKMFRKKLDELL